MTFGLMIIFVTGLFLGTLIGYSLKNYELRNRK